ncbi:MAG: hypothetical protein WBQ94_05335 [Terracidiphilus sp.]
MNLGFELAGVGLFIWASFDYNRFIKFWMIKPAPYSMPVRAVFRLFFLACVAGALWQIGEDARHFQWSLRFCLFATLVFIVGMAVIFVMINVVEWMGLKRLGRRQNLPVQRP